LWCFRCQRLQAERHPDVRGRWRPSPHTQEPAAGVEGVGAGPGGVPALHRDRGAGLLRRRVRGSGIPGVKCYKKELFSVVTDAAASVCFRQILPCLVEPCSVLLLSDTAAVFVFGNF
jgi:hypothetical protein